MVTVPKPLERIEITASDSLVKFILNTCDDENILKAENGLYIESIDLSITGIKSGHPDVKEWKLSALPGVIDILGKMFQMSMDMKYPSQGEVNTIHNTVDMGSPRELALALVELSRIWAEEHQSFSFVDKAMNDIGLKLNSLTREFSLPVIVKSDDGTLHMLTKNVDSHFGQPIYDIRVIETL